MDFNIQSLVFSIVKTTKVQNSNSQNNQGFEIEAKVANNQNQAQKEMIVLPQPLSSVNAMTNTEMNVFLREMLNLPKEWISFLTEFISVNGANIKGLETQLANLLKSNQLSALLQLNPKVDFSLIAKMLSDNASLMTDKMLKLMSGANFDKTLVNQIKEMSLIAASIAGMFNVNQNDFIRSIVQMYLPWLPFVPPEQRENMEMLTEAFSDEEKHSNPEISFFVTTVSLGIFKIEIIEDKEVEVYVNRISEKIDETDNDLQKELERVSTKYFKNLKFFYSSKEAETDNIKKEKELHIVNSSNNVISLILMQMLSRKIFETDESKNIADKRLSNIEDTTPNK